MCVYIHIIYIYIYHIFCIHSSTDDHLGCSHVLAIVNSAALNIGVRVSFCTIVLSSYMLRSGITGSCGNDFLIFQGNSILFSIVAAPEDLYLGIFGLYKTMQLDRIISREGVDKVYLGILTIL